MCEVVFADRAAGLPEGRERLALRVQCLTALPNKRLPAQLGVWSAD
jgi:hypothetical protein